ncbi:MAG: hypothetical protein RIG62_13800 [Cyclobacteriaceae bacterium]
MKHSFLKSHKKILLISLALPALSFLLRDIQVSIDKTVTIDSLGACQGVSYQHNYVYLYGDREVGIIRQYQLGNQQLSYTGQEYQLTENREDVIGHPTGLAIHDQMPVFLGNTVRMNPEGTSWQAYIYQIDWAGLRQDKTLDGHVLNVIEDDACIQGARPEYVRLGDQWWVASADYGPTGNEVRLYDPQQLTKVKKTSAPGVLYKKFSCGAWVQNLHWLDEEEILVLVQNQEEGKKWRLTFLDFPASVEQGKAQVIKIVDIDRNDELEGFTFLDDPGKGIAVTAHRSDNVSYLQLQMDK